MPNWDRSTLEAYERRRARKSNPDTEGGQVIQPERNSSHEQMGQDAPPKKGSIRTLVRITSCRVRLLDKDNLYGGAKPYVDALRYCGALEDDSPEAIELEIYQTKVKETEERTIIEIIPIP